MTDTNHIEVLRAVRSVFDHIPEPCEERAALDAAITALSARASAGEGVVSVKRDTLERAITAFPVLRTMLGREGLAGADIAEEFLAELREALANSPAAPQPAQAGASGELVKSWRERANRMLPTSGVDTHWHQGARDGMTQCAAELERALLAAAPQPQPTINSSEIDSKLTDARPTTPPAHGDGEGDKSEMADSDRLNSGKPVSPREIDKNQAHDLALSPTPEAQEARDVRTTKSPDQPGWYWRDDPMARRIVDAAVYQPGRREDILLDAVILLLRENAVFRKHTLRVLETTITPMFIPTRDGDGGRDG